MFECCEVVFSLKNRGGGKLICPRCNVSCVKQTTNGVYHSRWQMAEKLNGRVCTRTTKM